jgi:hypothetical protein
MDILLPAGPQHSKYLLILCVIKQIFVTPFANNEMKRFCIVFVTGMILFFGFSCRDEDYITDPGAAITFSADTITFDTIFTSIGSTTKQLKIYNPYKQSIRISQIYLAKGDNSYFRLNIDGDVTDHANDIEIPSKDSLFIFIAVTIDPFGVNNPMVINDSIVFVTNGNVQDVKLIAYGQDVHLIDGELIESQTWVADKPYLIYNSMGVDSAHTLIIEAGVKLYFHEGSQLIVLGSLIVNGTKENPVIFRGDRLDEVLPDLPYDKIPDQWGGIVIYPYSRGNRLNYCHIRNAEVGIFMPGALGYDYQSEIEIKNSIIENHSYAGIYAFNAKITAFNCLIVNCGTYTFAGLTGGEYNLYHCTISNHYMFSGIAEPAVVLTNFVYYNDSLISHDLQNTNFINCIIEGRSPYQLELAGKPENVFDYRFEYCLIEVSKDSINADSTELFKEIVFDGDPKFKKIPSQDDPQPDRYIFDFSLDTLSPAKDKGTVEIINQFPELEFDITGNSRLMDNGPDLGAYERIE